MLLDKKPAVVYGAAETTQVNALDEDAVEQYARAVAEQVWGSLAKLGPQY